MDNNHDMLSKNRQRYPMGEESSNSKITEEDVLEIRRLYASGVKQRRIAERFPVNYKTIHKIVHRQRWKHI